MSTFGIDNYLLHIAYGSQGIVICVANGILLAATLLERTLRVRKEMLIIAGAAGTDVIYGLGTAVLAFYRIYIIANGEQNFPMTAWNCITIPPLFLINIGIQLTSVMNVVVSIDRLIAVSSPTIYRNLNRKYAWKVLALVTLFGAMSLTMMFITTYFYTSPTPTLTKLCTNPAISLSYSLYQTTFITCSGYVSVAIYLAVFVVYRRSMRQIAPIRPADDKRSIAQQHRLTVTIGMITASTFVFFIVPFSILAVCTWMSIAPPLSTAVLGTFARFSTINNVVIFVYRHKDMRKAMWTCVTCKKAVTTVAPTVAARRRNEAV